MENSDKNQLDIIDEYEKERIKSHLDLQEEVPIYIRTVEGIFTTLALSNDKYRDKISDERIPSQEAVRDAKAWVDKNEL